jgi:hypothetical protein
MSQYCEKAPGMDAGKCMHTSDKIGSTCVIFPTGKTPRLGIDDALLCGKAVFSDATSEFSFYDWLGSCEEGVCMECAGNALTAAATEAEKWLLQDANSPTWSLMCDDRRCDRGNVVPFTSAFAEIFPTAVTSAKLAFLVMAFLLALGACMSNCFRRKENSKVIKEIGEKAEKDADPQLRGLLHVLSTTRPE